MSDGGEAPGVSSDHASVEHRMSPQMHLNMEEIRILKECNRESFYYRSLPLGAIAVAATQLAINKGYLRSHAKWGSLLKLTGAGFVGWFVGKLSYRSACEEKFLHLYNSPLAELIRKKKGYPPETLKDGSPNMGEMTLNPDDAPVFKVDDDFTSSSRSLNLDMDKNVQYSDLDDKREYDNQPEDQQQKYSTTYDDLRRKNREEYELRQSKLYQSPSTSSSVPPPSVTPKDWRNLGDRPQTRQSTYRPESSGMENAYGDRWDK